MDEKRLIVAIALCVLVFVLWQFLFVDQEAQKKPAQKPAANPATAEKSMYEAPPEKEKGEAVSAEKYTASHEAQSTKKEAKTVTVDTPLYRVQISEKGAVFSSFTLKKYREKVQRNAPLKELLSPDILLETLKSEFAGARIPGFEDAVYYTKQDRETLTVSDSSEELTFFWESDRGIRIEKKFTFFPESYLIGLEIEVINQSEKPLQGQMTVALNGKISDEKRMYGFEGASALINNRVEEIKIKKDEERQTFSGNLKWIAIQDRYFMTSILIQNGQEASMNVALTSASTILAQHVQAEKILQPGARYRSNYHLFFGPKSMKILRQIGYDLGKAIDFGWFDFIAKPCLWLMNILYDIIPNYGVAIIILTVLTKIILWPLGSKSYKSMSEMKKVQPLMQEIREKHKNDRKKMNEEVMALYRTYKINPLGGCLPMVVQIPVFFALYRMLYQAIELRHAPFFLWIDDLSAPDRLLRFGFTVPFMEPPYGIPVLTLVMGATMLLQQKMSPPMGDPTQAKMMMLMPIVFTVIFINFSSGLVLYWLVNNVLSIGQQYYIQKKFAIPKKSTK